MQTFLLVHLVTKFGTAANDAATSLKLLEKGLRKEDLALAVLIDFPFQILFGYLAARWSKGEKPLQPVRPPPFLIWIKAEGVVVDRHVDEIGLGNRFHVTYFKFPSSGNYEFLFLSGRRLHCWF